MLDDDEHRFRHRSTPSFVEQVDDGRGGVGAVAEDRRRGDLLGRPPQPHELLPAGRGVGVDRATATFFDASRPFMVG